MHLRSSVFVTVPLAMLSFACLWGGCSGAPLEPSPLGAGSPATLDASAASPVRIARPNLEADVVVTIEATSAAAGEAGPVAGEFTVATASYYRADPLIVNYTVSGTATSGADYTPLSGSVAIPAGQTSAPISVIPIDDTVQEPLETVIVTLTIGTGYIVGSPGAATVTIADNDTVVRCRCTSISYEFEPGGGKPKWGVYLVNGNSTW